MNSLAIEEAATLPHGHDLGAWLLAVLALMLVVSARNDDSDRSWGLIWPGLAVSAGLAYSALIFERSIALYRLPPFSEQSRYQLLFPMLGIGLGLEGVRRWRAGEDWPIVGTWALAVFASGALLVAHEQESLVTLLQYSALSVALQLAALSIMPSRLTAEQGTDIRRTAALLMMAALVQQLIFQASPDLQTGPEEINRSLEAAPSEGRAITHKRMGPSPP